MKKIFKYFVVLMGGALLMGCDLDIAPADSLTGEQMSASPTGLVDILNGCYATMKDFPAGESGENYWWGRQYFQMADFASDDIVYGQKTPDDLNMIFRYDERAPQTGNFRSFWSINYKIIYTTNVALATIAQKEELTAEDQYLRGEALLIKAFCLHTLVKMYAKQYDPATAATDKGVIIRYDSTDAELKDRETVAETYTYILGLLEQAEKDMTEGSSERVNNKGFASLAAVQALLSRVYLFMQDWDKCIEYSTKVINNKNYALEDADTFPTYLTETFNRKETIWCMKFNQIDNKNSSAVASMIYKPGGGCWGEEGYSKSLLDEMNFSSEKYQGVDTRISFVCDINPKNGLNLYPCAKHSMQDGIPTLNSPVLFRLAEMYFNRAEANAHKGNTDEAIADLNEIIKHRMNFAAAAAKGYTENSYYLTKASIKTDIVDLVLSQKRTEFSFEAHRLFDLLRNKKDIVRNYWGYHVDYVPNQSPGQEPGLNFPGVVTKYNYPRLVYPIPQQEKLNNPAVTQNEGYEN